MDLYGDDIDHEGSYELPYDYELDLYRLEHMHLHNHSTSRSRYSTSSFADSEFSDVFEEDMSGRKRPGERGPHDGPHEHVKRFRHDGPVRGRPPPRFPPPSRGGPPYHPRYPDYDDPFFPPPPPFPYDGCDEFPPPPPTEYSDGHFRPPPPPHSSRHRHHREGDHCQHRNRNQRRNKEEIPPEHGQEMPSDHGDPTLDEVLFMGSESDRNDPPPVPPPPSQLPVSDHRSEFDYLYKYGHLDRQEKMQGRAVRMSSASSGYASDHGQSSPTKSRGSPPKRPIGRGQQRGGLSRGFLGGKGTEDKWSVVESGSPTRGRGQGRGRGRGEPTGRGITRGQPFQRGRGATRGVGRGRGSAGGQGPAKVIGEGENVMKHKPLPPAKPSNTQSLLNVQKGVHSMAAVSKPDIANMSEVEKIFRFMVFVRNEAPKINDIQTIENAITATHLGLKTIYESEEVGNYSGRRIFTGTLRINNVFLARVVGQTKKELKHECYKLAIEVLKTKNVTQILQQKDVGIESIRKSFEEAAKKESEREAEAAKLANAAPIAVAIETVATPEQRWLEFIKFVKAGNPAANSPISRIEMALTGSRCGLERQYAESKLENVAKPMFEGSLTVAGVLLGQALGMKKKEAKTKTYEIAEERLTTLELSEILKGFDPLQVMQQEPLEEVTSRKHQKCGNPVVKEIKTPEQVKRFEIFVDRIKDSAMREGPITLLDMTASQLQLLITCIYRKIPLEGLTYAMQMYIGDILVSEGQGKQRKETQMDAYSKAYELLISTPFERIISDSHRLNPEELEDPEIDELVVKGQIRQVESNLSRLKKQHPYNLEEAMSEKKSDGLVIVEHEDWIHDRKKHAFCILQNSALMNVMLMEWFMESMTGFFNCKVSIQKEELGSAWASSKQVARNLAAADVLFRMYETHPVLRIIATEDTEQWVTREQMLQKMEEMPDGDFEDPLAHVKGKKQTPSKAALKREPEALTKNSASQIDIEAKLAEEEKQLLELKLNIVAQKMVAEFAEKGNVLDELVFSPDLPTWIRRTLPVTMAEYGLRAHQRQKDGQLYLAVAMRTRVDKIVEAMLARGMKKTNKFLLVEDRSELPCHADIVPDLEAARANPRKLEHPRSRLLRPGSNRSLNGSLFEETVDGFVTAQSSFLADGNSTVTALSAGPVVQSTPVKQLDPSFSEAGTSVLSSGQSACQSDNGKFVTTPTSAQKSSFQTGTGGGKLMNAGTSTSASRQSVCVPQPRVGNPTPDGKSMVDGSVARPKTAGKRELDQQGTVATPVLSKAAASAAAFDSTGAAQGGRSLSANVSSNNILVSPPPPLDNSSVTITAPVQNLSTIPLPQSSPKTGLVPTNSLSKNTPSSNIGTQKSVVSFKVASNVKRLPDVIPKKTSGSADRTASSQPQSRALPQRNPGPKKWNLTHSQQGASLRPTPPNQSAAGFVSPNSGNTNFQSHSVSGPVAQNNTVTSQSQFVQGSSSQTTVNTDTWNPQISGVADQSVINTSNPNQYYAMSSQAQNPQTYSSNAYQTGYATDTTSYSGNSYQGSQYHGQYQSGYWQGNEWTSAEQTGEYNYYQTDTGSYHYQTAGYGHYQSNSQATPAQGSFPGTSVHVENETTMQFSSRRRGSNQ